MATHNIIFDTMETQPPCELESEPESELPPNNPPVRPPNIGIPNADAKNCAIGSVLQILRQVPNFCENLHHFLNCLLLSATSKDSAYQAYEANVSCKDCENVVYLSNTEKRMEKKLINIDDEVKIFELMINIHEIFKLQKEKSNQKANDEVINTELDNKLVKNIRQIREIIEVLNYQSFGKEDYCCCIEFLVEIISRLRQLIETYECGMRSQGFKKKSGFLGFETSFEKMFVTTGTAIVRCEMCRKKIVENFEFTVNDFHIPLEMKNNEYAKAMNIIGNNFMNVKTKNVELTCGCGRIDETAANRHQTTDEIEFTRVADIQFVAIDRMNTVVVEKEGDDDKKVAFIRRSKLETGIPLTMSCFCDECQEQSNIHQFKLINIITNVSTNHFVAYIKNMLSSNPLCSAAQCCSPEVNSKTSNAEIKPNVQFTRIDSNESEFIDQYDAIKQMDGPTHEYARLLVYQKCPFQRTAHIKTQHKK